MRRNKIRELLKAGKPTLGTHMHSSWLPMVEAAGHSGMFDYIEFVAEYTSFDMFTMENFCRTCELYELSSMIKVDQEPRISIAQRGIGAGFQSVLFADVRTVDDAKHCVRIARPETPQDGGLYGVAARRSAYMGYGATPEYLQYLRDVVVVLMIEKKSAVEQLEEILAVPGVDMIQWGPADYSVSIGRPGEWGSPDLKAVERRVFETALKAGVPPRCEINSADQAKYFLDMGVRHFCIGTDVFVWYDWCKQNGEAMRKVLEA
jgi:4-hydroxy-2-oxoheptanedioate aldolase